MAADVQVQCEFSTPSFFRCWNQGHPLSSDAKTIVLNVYSFLRRDSSTTISSAVTLTANMTGLSRNTIWSLKCEMKSFGRPRSPLRSSQSVRRSLEFTAEVGDDGRTAKKPRLDVHSKQDSFTLNAIRSKVHQFFMRNEIPTVDKLLADVNIDPDLPNFSRTSFHRLLKAMNFEYRKRKRDSALISRSDLITWRTSYLRSVREFRRSGRPIVYLDETWLNAGHTKSKVWHDNAISSSKEAFSLNLSTGLKAPSGKGSRLIITHAGNENGFIDGALDIFEGKKGTDDYHDEMNGNRFEHWFRSKLLPNIEPHSIIIMDNASYHSVRCERLPTTKTKKADIQAWLTSKGISWSSTMLVKDLLALVGSVRHHFQAYNIDRMAEEAGHTILRLPPYHCELNPIELIWSQVKGYVAANNKSFTLREARVLLSEAISRVTSEKWNSCVKHVVNNVEPKFRTLDCISDGHIEPFIISTGDDSDDSELEDDD